MVLQTVSLGLTCRVWGIRAGLTLLQPKGNLKVGDCTFDRSFSFLNSMPSGCAMFFTKVQASCGCVIFKFFETLGNTDEVPVLS